VLDEDEIWASLYYSGPGERELYRERLRGEDPDESLTPTPEQPDTGDWNDLLISEKQYPEGVFDDPLFELAEEKAELQEVWERFGFEGVPPDIDWDSRIVLFAGTGESGTCPLFLNDVEFNSEHRVIVLHADTNLPEDTECTADWTPRVFVIAMNADYLGEGVLRAMFDRPDLEEIGPDDGEVIREG
jgi:hypothetical protein